MTRIIMFTFFVVAVSIVQSCAVYEPSVGSLYEFDFGSPTSSIISTSEAVLVEEMLATFAAKHSFKSAAWGHEHTVVMYSRYVGQAIAYLELVRTEDGYSVAFGLLGLRSKPTPEYCPLWKELRALLLSQPGVLRYETSCS